MFWDTCCQFSGGYLIRLGGHRLFQNTTHSPFHFLLWLYFLLDFFRGVSFHFHGRPGGGNWVVIRAGGEQNYLTGTQPLILPPSEPYRWDPRPHITPNSEHSSFPSWEKHYSQSFTTDCQAMLLVNRQAFTSCLFSCGFVTGLNSEVPAFSPRVGVIALVWRLAATLPQWWFCLVPRFSRAWSPTISLLSYLDSTPTLGSNPTNSFVLTGQACL